MTASKSEMRKQYFAKVRQIQIDRNCDFQAAAAIYRQNGSAKPAAESLSLDDVTALANAKV